MGHRDAPIEPPLLNRKQRLLQEAMQLFKKWQYRDAEQRSVELLEVAQHSQDTKTQTVALLIAGQSQESLGEYRTSLRSFEQMLTLPQHPQQEKTALGWAYNGIGLAYIGLGEHTKAIENFKKYLDLEKRLGDEAGQGAACGSLGNAYITAGQYESAIEYLEKQLEIAEQLDDEPGQGRACGNLGCAYDGLGQYKTAIEYLNKDLDIAKRLNDTPGQGKAYANLGNAYDGLGQCKEAIGYHQSCLEIAKQLDDKPGQRAAYNNLGCAHHGLGQYKEAIGYHRSCLEIAEQLDDKPGQGIAYGNLGNAHRGLGQYEEAIGYHQSCLDIVEQLDDLPGQGAAYGNLGNAYSSSGQYKMAIQYHQKHLDIAKQLNDKLGQKAAFGNLGFDFAQSGQLEEACCHFASSDALVRQLEAQLAHGQWRRHLLAFGEEHTRFMDSWVVAAARSGDMAEALRVEERRRCQSELAYQADAVRGRHEGEIKDDDVSVDGLKAMATSVGAAFVVVMKKFDSALLTWVLSGETGELVYERCLDKAYEDEEIAEWMESVTFAGWAEWQRAFGRARRRITEEESSGRFLGQAGLKRAAELFVPDGMKGDLDEELWASIRDPATFPETVCGLSVAFKNLQQHFFQRADKAMEELSKLVWEPIVNECPALERVVRGDCPSTKPVSAVFFSSSFSSLSRSLVFRVWCVLCCPLWLQIYFLPDPSLSSIPFCALKTGGHYLIEKALVAQASSLRTLDCARVKWEAICSESRSPSKVGMECSFHDAISSSFTLLFSPPPPPFSR